MPSISGQSVLIIGGSTGIGFAIAELCVQEKMEVHIASSSPDRIENARTRLKALDTQAAVIAHVANLGGDNIEATLADLLTAASSGRKLDHIVVTAGKPNPRPLAEINLPYLVNEASLPLFTPILLGKLAPPHLNQHWTSSITFTGGQVAEKPFPGYAAHSALAGALHPFTKALALEIKPVRSNCVSPGSTETELWGDRRAMMRGLVSKKALLGKPGGAHEVAEAYVYLMKDTNATGVNITSNGGSTFQ